MSSPQQPSDNNSERSSQSGNNATIDSRAELPSFQPFPAAAREARPRPSSRSQTTSGDSRAPEAARRGMREREALDDTSLPGSGHRTDAGNLVHRERQRTATLPAFTPFPSAAPGSRWAPPEGVRPEPARPMPPPAFEPESMHYLPAYHGDAARYSSGLPGQPSPYAPPGPLTARPHVCEHCETGFARAHDLRRHLETHKVGGAFSDSEYP
ncbi:hypothetical protein FS749_013052 [Ceratobasidium sp. UAMH 11750]|nr:hypothetical protein FS749_013052 [Ceratobasidium sp. UAMH 11750]